MLHVPFFFKAPVHLIVVLSTNYVIGPSLSGIGSSNVVTQNIFHRGPSVAKLMDNKYLSIICELWGRMEHIVRLP